MIHQLKASQVVNASLEDVWAYFSIPGNLNDLTPPAMNFEILSGDDKKAFNGQIITYRIEVIPKIKVNWVTELKHVAPLESFVDEQRFGPYAFWHHLHEFVPVAGGVEIRDTVHYRVGFGFVGEVVRALWIKRQLEMIFAYRKERVAALFV